MIKILQFYILIYISNFISASHSFYRYKMFDHSHHHPHFNGFYHPRYYNFDSHSSDSENINEKHHRFDIHLTREYSDSSISEENGHINLEKTVQLKYTNTTPESIVPEYTRVLLNSKVFKYKSHLNQLLKINLLSTTKYFHPSLKIFKRKHEKIIELVGENKNFGKFSSIYKFKKGFEYIIEVGTIKPLDSSPFKDISSGGFVLIISSELDAIDNLLGVEPSNVVIFGFKGIVPTKNDQKFDLTDKKARTINYGLLDYKLTPFFNESASSITLYYHNGSNLYTGRRHRSSTVEFVCKKDLADEKIGKGKEPSFAKYEFKVNHRKICDLIDASK